MKVLVQKFGGTSVSTPERRQQVVAKILAAKAAGFSPVVVVSAPGRAGEPYATDTLLALAREECPSIGKREQDLIMTCGEIVGGVIVVGTLKSTGTDAVFLTGQQAGIITTMTHGDAQVIRIKPDNILAQLAAGRVVVVAGFQGVSESGEITTLGRGGSDTSAAALGAAIGAAAVEIYTDVNGIMTADPRVVPTAYAIPFISPQEAYQMAIQGAKVIHPRAVEVALRHKLPLKIKCTFSDEEGTLIANGETGTIERLRGRVAVGLAHKNDYGLLRLAMAERGKGAAVFDHLAGIGLEADFISVSRETIDIIAGQGDIEAFAAQARKKGIVVIDQIKDCVKISLIGYWPSTADAVSTFVDLLYRGKIKALHTFTGPFTVSGVVAKDEAAAALRLLHDGLLAEEKQEG